jgi:uncharacterized repeat protein (TIGR01451 family)
VDNGDTISWTGIAVPAKSSTTLTYTAQVIGTFSGSSGGGGCAQGQYPVVNTVTITGGGQASATLCVNAAPDLHVVKEADATTFGLGDTITYTLTFSNDGTAEEPDAVIREQIPEGTEFVGCTGDCATDGPPVTEATWTRSVAAGGSGSVTLTVRVLQNAGCQICNVATISSGPQGTLIPSNEVCLQRFGDPQPDLAHASGSGFAAYVNALGIVETTPAVADVASAQSGIGTASDQDEVLGLTIHDPFMPPNDIMRAKVAQAVSTSTVTGAPAEANQTTIAETADVNILEGLVTAGLVRAVASTTANGTSSSFSSLGSTFDNLQVDLDGSAGVGQPTLYEDVTPGQRIDLPAGVFGAGSYIALYERTGSTSGPTPGQLSGGTYAADLVVNMIHVHISGLAGEFPTEIFVSRSVAHADFPQIACLGPSAQSVSGHAFILSENTDPSILPVLHGLSSIPPSGGSDHQNLLEVRVPNDASTARTGAAESDSSGSLGAESSDSSSWAQAADLCLLPDPAGVCLVGADLVRAESNSHAADGGASSNDGDGDGDGNTVLAGVSIDGTDVCDLLLMAPGCTPEPNTKIELPGLGFVILNEQFCDDGPAPTTPGPVTCSGASASGRTVRAIRLVLLGPPPEGNPGLEIIVVEAHSDASFPAPTAGSGLTVPGGSVTGSQSSSSGIAGVVEQEVVSPITRGIDVLLGRI